MFRNLSVAFESLETFRREYQRNIANGGMFVPTDAEFEMREVVDLELRLTFCGKVVPLQSEVVARVDRTLEEPSRVPGVAVQFLEPIDELRLLLAEMAGIAPAAPPEPSRSWLERPGRTRRHPRVGAEVPAEMQVGDEGIAGQSRNLSRSGALIKVDGEPPALGARITLVLANPATGESRELPGHVVRHARDVAGGLGVGVEFDEGIEESETNARFIEAVSRGIPREDAISGPISGLGLTNLLQMFSSSTDRGTLAVRRGLQTGTVVFEGGGLQRARSGQVTGMKALSRLLAWEEGSFEFQPTTDGERSDEPTPIYGAILEALQHVDELRRLDLSRIAPDAFLALTDKTQAENLDELDARILERLSAGPEEVESLVDSMPEFDSKLYESLLRLLEKQHVQLKTER